jgi:hypothetical protein
MDQNNNIFAAGGSGNNPQQQLLAQLLASAQVAARCQPQQQPLFGGGVTMDAMCRQFLAAIGTNANADFGGGTALARQPHFPPSGGENGNNAAAVLVSNMLLVGFSFVVCLMVVKVQLSPFNWGYQKENTNAFWLWKHFSFIFY